MTNKKVLVFCGCAFLGILVGGLGLCSQEVLEGQKMCARAASGREQAQSLANRLDVVLQGESTDAQAFQKLLNTGAVFKTKTRESAELKTDFSEIFQKADFKILDLVLLSGQSVPVAPEEAVVHWEGELDFLQNYLPNPAAVFTTQRWVLTLAPSQKENSKNLSEVWSAALHSVKKTTNVGFWEVEKSAAANGQLRVTLETGMIPAMTLPHRTLKNADPSVQIWKSWLSQTSWVPPFLRSVNCVQKQDRLYELAVQKFQAQAHAGLERLELLDRMKWLAAAEKRARAFLEQAGQL